MVTAPYVVVRVVKEFYVGEVGAGAVALGGDGAVDFFWSVDTDLLKAGDVSSDFCKFFPDDCGFVAAPVPWICDGPGEPDGGLVGPLWRHVEAFLDWSNHVVGLQVI